MHHHRLVHGVVGRPLCTFDCTKQLVTAVLDALKGVLPLSCIRGVTLTHEREAHSRAFELAKILHRDISAGNILLTDEGRGLLIDWELAKNVDQRDGTVSASVLPCHSVERE